MSDTLRIEDWIGRGTATTDRLQAEAIDCDDPEPCEGDTLQSPFGTASLMLCGRLAMQADAAPAA